MEVGKENISPEELSPGEFQRTIMCWKRHSAAKIRATMS